MSSCRVGELTVQLLYTNESLEAVYEGMNRAPVRVFFVNAHCVVVAQTDRVYRQAVEHAEFVFNDGAGIEAACRLLGKPVKANLNGTDWIPRFFHYLSQQGRRYRIFFLGCRPEVVAANADALSLRWPLLETVGLQHGYFDQDEAVVQKIIDARPDILLVGMGVPRQELFLDRHWSCLAGSGLRIGIAGGAIFDFVTGTVPRAPEWMRRLRIEWLYRFWQEPRRLFYRYTIEIIVFSWIVMKQRLRTRRG